MKIEKYLVYYGFAKLTPKIVRKRSIVIMFENCNIWNERKEKFLKQKLYSLTITLEQFLDNCTDDELKELDLLLQAPRYAQRIESVNPITNPPKKTNLLGATKRKPPRYLNNAKT